MTREVREKAVSFAAESTYGTDPNSGSPTAFFKVTGDSPVISPITEVIESEEVCATQDGIAHQTFSSHNDVSATIYLRGKESAAGDAPLWADLLKAAGFEETIAAGVDAQYDLVTFHTTSVAPSATFYEDVFYSDGNARRGVTTGVRGNIVLTAEMDTYCTIAFTGIGLFGELPAATTSVTAPASYDGGKSALVCRDMTVTIGGTGYDLRSFDVNTNWALEEDRSQSGTSSLDQVFLRRPSASRVGGTLEFADVTLFEQILSDLSANTEAAMVAEWSDGTDTVTLTQTIQFGNYTRNGGSLGTYSVPYFVTGSPNLAFT